MQTLNYITDTNGNKTGMLLNFTNDIESKILNYWLNEPDAKRQTVNLYFAQFLYEMSGSETEKRDLQNVINKLQNTENKTVKDEPVAYTTSGKPLTKKEYTDIILQASDEAHKGINLVEHSEVEKRMNQKFAEYENNLA